MSNALNSPQRAHLAARRTGLLGIGVALDKAVTAIRGQLLQPTGGQRDNVAKAGLALLLVLGNGQIRRLQKVVIVVQLAAAQRVSGGRAKAVRKDLALGPTSSCRQRRPWRRR